jgi:hypothetical protein
VPNDRPKCDKISGLERFQAKWGPVRVKKMRQIKNLEPRFDSIETEEALDTLRQGASNDMTIARFFPRKLAIALSVVLLLLAATIAGIGFVVSQTGVRPEAIEVSVSRSEATIDRAWQLPAARAFKRDVSWQSNASLCGPASVANVNRSLGDQAIDEQKVLKGTGRCWSGYCFLGLTLDELAEVAQANSRRRVTVLRDLTPEAFRDHLRRSNDPARRYIINFNRKGIFGSGAGHHSPIGGYLEADDSVFILDVNRDFRPWIVDRGRLFDAMNTFDGDKKRGLLLIE